MNDFNPDLFSEYLFSGYEELVSYYEYVELVNSNRLPVLSDTDTYPAANIGNSLTIEQRYH